MNSLKYIVKSIIINIYLLTAAFSATQQILKTELKNITTINRKFSEADINYVLSKYEKKFKTKKSEVSYLFYPAKKPKRLLILFNGARKGKYLMWSWFWNNNEDWKDTAYLFLKDDTLTFYVGAKDWSFIPVYSEIIEKTLKACFLDKNQVFTYGISMGGYAAVYYAIILKLKGAIVYDPQVNFLINAKHGMVLSKELMFTDLDQLITQSDYLPHIFIQYSKFGLDFENAAKLLESLKNKHLSLVSFRQVDSSIHVDPLKAPTKKFITHTIEYFEKLDEEYH